MGTIAKEIHRRTGQNKTLTQRILTFGAYFFCLMCFILVGLLVHTWTYNPHVLKKISTADISRHLTKSLKNFPSAVKNFKFSHLQFSKATIEFDAEQFDTPTIPQGEIDELLVSPPTRYKAFDAGHGFGAAATVLVHIAAYVSKKQLAALYTQADVNALLDDNGWTNRNSFDAKYGAGASDRLLKPHLTVPYRKILMEAKKNKLKRLRQKRLQGMRAHGAEEGHRDVHQVQKRQADEHRDSLVRLQKEEMEEKHQAADAAAAAAAAQESEKEANKEDTGEPTAVAGQQPIGVPQEDTVHVDPEPPSIPVKEETKALPETNALPETGKEQVAADIAPAAETATHHEDPTPDEAAIVGEKNEQKETTHKAPAAAAEGTKAVEKKKEEPAAAKAAVEPPKESAAPAPKKEAGDKAAAETKEKTTEKEAPTVAKTEYSVKEKQNLENPEKSHTEKAEEKAAPARPPAAEAAHEPTDPVHEDAAHEEEAHEPQEVAPPEVAGHEAAGHEAAGHEARR
jgi:hypothetical protein